MILYDCDSVAIEHQSVVYLGLRECGGLGAVRSGVPSEALMEPIGMSAPGIPSTLARVMRYVTQRHMTI